MTHGKGFQTWEYSPVYAIRSWFYLLLHSPIPVLVKYFDADKKIAFFGTRAYLALISSLIETAFYRSIVQNVNERIGRYVLIFLLSSAGMYISTIGECDD